MGQVWSKADCDGIETAGHEGGRGSCIAVTAHTPGPDGFWDGIDDFYAPMNTEPGEATIDIGSVTGDRVRGFNSMHSSGGCNFVKCDGSIEFITETIDLSAYRSLSTINGREMVADY